MIIVQEGEPEDDELTELYEGLTSMLNKVAKSYSQGTQIYDERQIEKEKEKEVARANAPLINNLISKLTQTRNNL